MATPPLETIPEETPAPATPVRVTADPPKTKPATEKNPGRVASGKRLAERNRLAREAKKKAEAEAAKPASTSATQASAATLTQSEDTNTEASSNSLMTILGIGGLVVSALGVYYQREAIMKRLKPTAQPTPPAPAQPEPEPTPSVSNSGKTRHRENGVI